MTREEQIEKAEIKYFDETRFDGCDYVGEVAKTTAFIAGTKWSDAHPKEGMVSLDKVCEWIEEHMSDFCSECAEQALISWLRKAMEE